MFAPKGYVPLSTIWEEFREKRFSELYRHACQQYASDEFAASGFDFSLKEFGSPSDYVEDIFIATLQKYTLTLYADGSEPIETRSQDVSGASDLFEKLTVLESTQECEQPSLPNQDLSWFSRMGSRNFSPWPDKRETLSFWKKQYPLPEIAVSELPRQKTSAHHTLPMWFERNRFTIPTEAPPWSQDASDTAIQMTTIPNFLGRSMCIQLKQARTWRRDHLTNNAYQAFMGLTVRPKQVGRPNKTDRAMAALDQIYPEGRGKTPWPEVCAAIEQETGESISQRTIQRALHERQKSRQNR